MAIAVVIAIIVDLLGASFRMAAPLIYTSVGEIFSERSGVVNIGLEGIMLIGAFVGFAVTFYTHVIELGLLAAVLSGLLCGLLFGLFTITIKANQIVVGAAVNFIGTGITGYLYRTLFSSGSNRQLGQSIFPPIEIPVLKDIPFLGDILFKQNVMVYACLLLVPLASFILFKTSFGLYTRAMGEHPRAADTVGISVTLIRYMGVLIGSTLAAVGGAYLSLAYANQFVEGMTTGRGFIALAVVVFSRWNPVGAMAVSILFGIFFAMGLQLQATGPLVNVPYQLLQALPYVATLLVLVALRGRSAGPKALGVPYEAGE